MPTLILQTWQLLSFELTEVRWEEYKDPATLLLLLLRTLR